MDDTDTQANLKHELKLEVLRAMDSALTSLRLSEELDLDPKLSRAILHTVLKISCTLDLLAQECADEPADHE